MTGMPEITYKGSTPEEKEIVKRITNKGRLRASSPTKSKKKIVRHGKGVFEYHFEYSSKKDRIRGRSVYVWRMVAFQVSPKCEHHCIPATADFNLASKDEHKELDPLVDRIVNCVPMKQWHGVIKWGRVLGTDMIVERSIV